MITTMFLIVSTAHQSNVLPESECKYENKHGIPMLKVNDSFVILEPHLVEANFFIDENGYIHIKPDYSKKTLSSLMNVLKSRHQKDYILKIEDKYQWHVIESIENGFAPKAGEKYRLSVSAAKVAKITLQKN